MSDENNSTFKKREKNKIPTDVSNNQKLKKELNLKYNLTTSETNIALKAYLKDKNYTAWLKQINSKNSLLKNKIKPKKRLKQLFDEIKKADDITSLAIDADNEKEDDLDIKDNNDKQTESKSDNENIKEIARQLRNDINDNIAPFMLPCKSGEYTYPCNGISKIPYTGVNDIYLSSLQKNVYKSDDPRWFTITDIENMKLSVKKGSFSHPLTIPDTIYLDEKGRVAERKNTAFKKKIIPKIFLLFHASQIEGLKPYKKKDYETNKSQNNYKKLCDNILTTSKAYINYNNSPNFLYEFSHNILHLPKNKNIDNYYSNAFHALSDYNSETEKKEKNLPKFISNSNIVLKSEITSYILCKTLNLDYTPREYTKNHYRFNDYIPITNLIKIISMSISEAKNIITKARENNNQLENNKENKKQNPLTR